MKEKLQIKICPTCGSDQIQSVVSDITRSFNEHTYVVPMLEYYECPVCGERLYDREAMQKIREYSPAYSSTKTLGNG